MNPFLRDTAITFLLVALCILPLEWTIGHQHDRLSYIDSYIRQHGDKISTLIIGNSLGSCDINPLQWNDSAFNAASPGRWLIYDVRVMQKYISCMPNLKTVVMPVFYNQSYSEHPKSIKRFQFARHMKIFVKKNYHEYSALLAGELHLKNMKSEKADRDLNGFMPLDRSWDGETITGRPTSTDEIIKNVAGYRRLLKNIAHQCKKNNVRMVIVIPPESYNYIQKMDPQIWSLLKETTDEVQRDCNVEVLDYSQHSDFRDHTHYADNVHLNVEGANLFSRVLKEDLGL